MHAIHPTLRTITASPEPAGPYIGPLIPALGRWLPVTEANPEARCLCRRHEACREGLNGTHARSSSGSGDRLVLITQ